MTNHDNQTAPQIYYRPLRKWLEVTPEEKQNWERFIGTTRKAKQRAGTCRRAVSRSVAHRFKRDALRIG